MTPAEWQALVETGIAKATKDMQESWVTEQDPAKREGLWHRVNALEVARDAIRNEFDTFAARGGSPDSDEPASP